MGLKNKMAKIKVIQQEGESALVEWLNDKGHLKRVYLPHNLIKTGADGELHAGAKALKSGIPFGLPWSTLIDKSNFDPEAFEAELNRRNIWTAADLMADPNAARAAIQTSIGLDFGILLRSAKEFLES